MKKYILLPVCVVLVLAGCGNGSTEKVPYQIEKAATPVNAPYEADAPSDSDSVEAKMMPSEDVTDTMAPTVAETTSQDEIIEEVDALMNDLDNI